MDEKLAPTQDTADPGYPQRRPPTRLVAGLRGAAGAAAAIAALALASCGGPQDPTPVGPPGEPAAPVYDSTAASAPVETSANAGSVDVARAQAAGDVDYDGIADANDGCPQDPEDRDAFEDQDGCPDPDNDQDGIGDVDDVCPGEPEDRDGMQDEDGCPDLP